MGAGCSTRRSASGGRLRVAHLSIDLGAAVDFARALTLVDIADREQVRAAGAAVFVRRRDDRADLRRRLRSLVATTRHRDCPGDFAPTTLPREDEAMVEEDAPGGDAARGGPRARRDGARRARRADAERGRRRR